MLVQASGESYVDAMKNEIYQRGPIGCNIEATEAFDAYTSGVFCVSATYTETNHAIAIVGWGFDTAANQEYWLLRNSWGTQWGDAGFAKVCTGQNMMLLESQCSWATPVDTWTNEDRHTTTDAE